MKTTALMKHLVLSILTVLFYLTTAFSQNFLNGSFENTTGFCNYNLNNNSFNAAVNNCFSFGANGIDILNTGCPFGEAQHGEVFLGIAFHNTDSTEALAMKLSSPLVVGQTYALSMYLKSDLFYPPNKLMLGYSEDSISFGTFIDSLPQADTIWTNEVLTFTPINNSRYITAAVVDSLFSWIHIDHFDLSFATGISAGGKTMDAFSVFPNPAKNEVSITFRNCDDLTLFNTLGILVMKKACFDSGEGKSTLDISGFDPGFYFIRMGKDLKKLVKE